MQQVWRSPRCNGACLLSSHNLTVEVPAAAWAAKPGGPGHLGLPTRGPLEEGARWTRPLKCDFIASRFG